MSGKARVLTWLVVFGASGWFALWAGQKWAMSRHEADDLRIIKRSGRQASEVADATNGGGGLQDDVQRVASGQVVSGAGVGSLKGAPADLPVYPGATRMAAYERRLGRRVNPVAVYEIRDASATLKAVRDYYEQAARERGFTRTRVLTPRGDVYNTAYHHPDGARLLTVRVSGKPGAVRLTLDYVYLTNETGAPAGNDNVNENATQPMSDGATP